MLNFLWFRDCYYSNIHLVGGKSASLGELSRIPSVNSADGFAVTTKCYEQFLEFNNIKSLIDKHHEKINNSMSILELHKVSTAIKGLFKNTCFPAAIESEMISMFEQLPSNIELAVRSSAIAEDLPHASFAGQQDTYLNINSFSELKRAIIDCFASLFNANAISYRSSNKIHYDQIKMAVCVQKMVRSDLGTAGVAFSLDPETGYSKAVVINSSYGLGEAVVGGQVNPDEFIVDKRVCETLDKAYDPILSKKLGQKSEKIVFKPEGTGIEVVPTTPQEEKDFSLTDFQIREIAETVLKLENHYQDLHEKKQGVDIEWAYDGKDKKLYILQIRAETVHSGMHSPTITKYQLLPCPHKTLLCEGVAIGEQISSGKIVYFESIADIETTPFFNGDILLTDMTTPDWEPLMKIAGGIITNKGGRTCHAAIVAREHRINAIIGTGTATTLLRHEDSVTLCCSDGDVGKIYQGSLPFDKKEMKIANRHTKAFNKVMFNVGSPNNAFSQSMYPNNGVGLARMEFIINNHIGVHPLQLIAEREENVFVKKLAQGVGKIASAFYPKEVIVRLSDFKTNEYKFLRGGEKYEPCEENPMIGWRGASRYYSKEYESAFRLECKALKYARETMMMTNIVVMIPFCRTPEECNKVIKIMADEGLTRGEEGLKIYLMCEIPSNVIEADRFAPYIDGVSIGGNDLMQLTLGVDRDSEKIAYLNDDKNESFRRMIKMTIDSYHKYGKKVGFCGQQPSNSKEFYYFLQENNIDTISVTPDTLSSLLDF